MLGGLEQGVPRAGAGCSQRGGERRKTRVGMRSIARRTQV